MNIVHQPVKGMKHTVHLISFSSSLIFETYLPDPNENPRGLNPRSFVISSHKCAYRFLQPEIFNDYLKLKGRVARISLSLDQTMLKPLLSTFSRIQNCSNKTPQGYPRKFGWVCAARRWKSLLYFTPKYVIFKPDPKFHTLFQTRSLPYFVCLNICEHL